MRAALSVLALLTLIPARASDHGYVIDVRVIAPGERHQSTYEFKDVNDNNPRTIVDVPAEYMCGIKLTVDKLKAATVMCRNAALKGSALFGTSTECARKSEPAILSIMGNGIEHDIVFSCKSR